MLTDLSFLDVDKKWPPPSEGERLSQYEANRRLFEGDHEEVFKDWVRLLRDDQQATLELIFNFHQRLSKLWADMMLGEEPVYRAGESEDDQAYLDELVERNDFNVTAYEVVLDKSRYGDGLFRVRREDDRAVIEGQSPEFWFPVVAPNNIRKILHHVLAWTYERIDPLNIPLTDIPIAERTKRYLRVEVHSPGSVEHRLYELNSSGQITSQVESPREVEPDFPEQIETYSGDGFLVIHAPGMRTADRLYGLDDYADLDTLMQELEARMAQISRILDKHSDPNMVGPTLQPSTVTHSDGSTQQVYVSGGRYFEIDDQSAVIPQYVTWDGKLDAQFKQIELLMEQLYLVSETTPAAFGQQKEGLAESGSALKRLLLSVIIKVRRLSMRFRRSVSAVLVTAAALEGRALDRVEVEFRDGLPQDESEQAQIESLRVGSQIASRKSAIKRLDGVNDEQADAELAQIAEEDDTPQLGIPALDVNFDSVGGEEV